MQAGSAAATDERHPRARGRAVIATLALAVLVLAPAAAFAKGASSTAPFIRLGTVDGAGLAAAAEPRLGSHVWFATGYPSGTKNAWVSVNCYQGDALVWSVGAKAGSDFTLGGFASQWVTNGGAASCNAQLGDLYWKGGYQYYKFLAETFFDAGE